jgi:hypothetical protein
MTIELKKTIPRSQQNPMRVLPCVELNEQGIATGIKETYTWIFDKDTECGEWIDGTNVKVITTVPDHKNRFLIHQVQTRRNVSGEINYYSQPDIIESVAEAHREGWLNFPREDPCIVGTTYEQYTFNDYGDTIIDTHFVSRHEQFSKYNFAQWQTGWKVDKDALEYDAEYERPTTENGFAAIQLWMLTTLSSSLHTGPDVSTNNTSRLILKARLCFPEEHFIDGLIFRNERLGTYAKISIKSLEFYHLYLKSNNINESLSREERNSIGIRLKEVIQELSNNASK